MNAGDAGQFVRFGEWLVNRDAIDAIGQQDGEHILVLRSGRTITLDRADVVQLWKELDGDWRDT